MESQPNAWNFDRSSMFLNLGLCHVYQGEFSRSDVVAAWEKKGWKEYETYHGYSLFKSTLIGAVGAIGDTAVVLKRSIDSLKSTKLPSKAVIDAKRGAADRYGDQSRAFKTLTNHLKGDLIWTGTNPVTPTAHFPMGSIGGGALRIDGETSNLTLAIVFDNSPNKEAVEQFLRSKITYIDESTKLEISKKKSTVLVKTNVKTSSVKHPSA